MTKLAFVYMLASKKHGTLYTGVTSNLERRMYQHKHHLFEGFTSKYDVTRLVWFAQGDDISSAISLEKKIKNRNRQWKIHLIEKTNPDWVDLAAGWMDSDPATSRRMTACDSALSFGAERSGVAESMKTEIDPASSRRMTACDSALSFGAERSGVAESMKTENRPCDCAQGDTLDAQGDTLDAQGDTLDAQGDTLRSTRNDEGERA